MWKRSGKKSIILIRIDVSKCKRSEQRNLLQKKSKMLSLTVKLRRSENETIIQELHSSAISYDRSFSRGLNAIIIH